MKGRLHRDELILKAINEAGGALGFKEIKNCLPDPKPDNKQLSRSLRRLWNQCEICHITKTNEWNPRAFFALTKPWELKADTRFDDALHGSVMGYLEDLCRIMSFEEAYQRLLEYFHNVELALHHPKVRKAFRDVFSPAQQGHSDRHVRGDAAER